MTRNWGLWLFNHLLFMGTMFLAAAPVIAGGEEAGEHADASANDGTGGSTVHEGAGVSDDAGAATEDSDAGAGEENADGTPKTKTSPADQKLDARSLPSEVKEFLKSLQGTNPKAHGWLKDTLYRERSYAQEFPGGVAEAKQLKESVATFTKEFPNGIEGVKSELADYRGLDELYDKGDPKAAEVWATANPEAYKKIMPAAIRQYAAIDPDGYQHFGADLISRTLNNAGAHHTLSFLQRAINAGDKEAALELLTEYNNFLGSIDQLAKTKPKEAAAPQDDAFKQREQRVAQQETQIWAQQTAIPINSWRSDFIRKEAVQYLPKGVVMDDDLAAAIERQTTNYLDEILGTDDDWKRTFGSYAEAKDTPGLTAYVKSKLPQILKSGANKQGPIEKATKLFFRGAAKPAPKPVPNGVKPNGDKPQNQAPASRVWQKVSPDQAPKPHEIDREKTTFEMGMAKQAVLKSGKRIYWGQNAPA